MDARQSANGIALNARVQFGGVDGGALRYRALAMPAGRVSMQATLASQGRSASALIGALSGNGTVTLESAKVAGLDPRAFEVAVRASDNGQVADDTRLRQIVEPALSAGALSVASAQIPFTIRDGRMRVGATALDAPGVRAVVSGGYDIPADQADIRANMVLTMALPTSGRPEIQLFAAGTPDALSRTVDVAALSSWLAVRAIDHETRRLDAIERGEPPPPAPAPVSLPPQEDPQPRRCRRMPAGPAKRRRTCRFRAAIRAVGAEGKSRRAATAGRAADRQCTCCGGPDSECAGGQSAGGATAAGDRGQAGAGCGQAETPADAAAGADAAGSCPGAIEGPRPAGLAGLGRRFVRRRWRPRFDWVRGRVQSFHLLREDHRLVVDEGARVE